MVAERLLLDRYSSAHIEMSSLDELRASVAMSSFKQNRSSAVVSNLPPTSNAFYHHCLRASRQSRIWYQALQSDIIIESMQN
jgi:hypothetical protein